MVTSNIEQVSYKEEEETKQDVQFNAGTLLSENRVVEINYQLENGKWDIIGISEVRG